MNTVRVQREIKRNNFETEISSVCKLVSLTSVSHLLLSEVKVLSKPIKGDVTVLSGFFVLYSCQLSYNLIFKRTACNVIFSVFHIFY